MNTEHLSPHIVEGPRPGDSIEIWLARLKDGELAALGVVVMCAMTKRMALRDPATMAPSIAPSFEERLRRLQSIDPDNKVHTNLMVISARWPDSTDGYDYHYTGTLTFMEFSNPEAYFETTTHESGNAMAHGEVVHNPVLPVSVGNRFVVNIHPLGKEKLQWPRA